MDEENKNVHGLLYRVRKGKQVKSLELRFANLGEDPSIFSKDPTYELIGRAIRESVPDGKFTAYTDFGNVFPADSGRLGHLLIYEIPSLEPTIVAAFVQYFGQDLSRGKNKK